MQEMDWALHLADSIARLCQVHNPGNCIRTRCVREQPSIFDHLERGRKDQVSERRVVQSENALAERGGGDSYEQQSE